MQEYTFFLIFAPKYRLRVLVRNASPRRFQRVPTIYNLSKNKKNVKNFLLKLSTFTTSEKSVHYMGMLDWPRRGGSNKYPQSMFWSKNMKNIYTPAYPSFTI